MIWPSDDIVSTVELLGSRGVMFEEYDASGLKTINGIAEVTGNYPSSRDVGEKAAWFRDLLGIGQPIR